MYNRILFLANFFVVDKVPMFWVDKTDDQEDFLTFSLLALMLSIEV